MKRLCSIALALTAEEAVAAIQAPVPIYVVTAPFNGMQIDTAYRQFGDSEWGMETYFTTEIHGYTTRVAWLRTCGICSPDGSGTGRSLFLPEPINSQASVYNVTAWAQRDRFFDGREYITSLYWWDDLRYRYQFYSIWSLEETEHFLSLLAVAN